MIIEKKTWKPRIQESCWSSECQSLILKMESLLIGWHWATVSVEDQHRRSILVKLFRSTVTSTKVISTRGSTSMLIHSLETINCRQYFYGFSKAMAKFLCLDLWLEYLTPDRTLIYATGVSTLCHNDNRRWHWSAIYHGGYQWTGSAASPRHRLSLAVEMESSIITPNVVWSYSLAAIHGCNAFWKVNINGWRVIEADDTARWAFNRPRACIPINQHAAGSSARSVRQKASGIVRSTCGRL